MTYFQQRQSWAQGMPKPEPVKKTYTIPKVSKKRAATNREYAAKSKPVWKGKSCEIKAPGCTGKAQGIHHLKGKVSSEMLLDDKWWKPACNHCNTWVEVNDAEARRLGLKLSKFN